MGRWHRLVGCAGQGRKGRLELFLEGLQLFDVGVYLRRLGLQLLLDVGTPKLAADKLRQYHADLSQRKPQRLRPAHKPNGLKMGCGVNAVTIVLAGRRLQQTLLFVVAHRVGGHADGFGELADVHGVGWWLL